MRTFLEQIEPKIVLLCGDLNVDQYTYGRVDRISPEAPVPVLRVERSECRPGSAGNAALNLCSLRQRVRIVSRVGEGWSGKALLEMLAAEDVDLCGVCVQEGWETPVKNRLIASRQQMIRIDTERSLPLSTDLEQILLTRIDALFEGVDFVAFSDYGKGFLTPIVLEAFIRAARQRNIPVLVDPKGRDFSRYRGATVIKPNQTEAYEASGLSGDASLDEVAAILRECTKADHLMITRAEEGMSLFSQSGREDLSTQVSEVRDVTGAGDTVLAMTAAALANRLPLSAAAQLANVAAGLAVRRFGCARISCDDLRAALVKN